MSELIGFYLTFYKSLDDFNVEYMTVGGHAVIYHGYVRATSDLDLWVNTENDNLARLFKALISLGYKEDRCKEAIKYLKENHMIKIPKGNEKIELLDSFMLKYDFTDSYKNHVTTILNGVRIVLIGYDDLLKCKQKANRHKDILDVKSLKEIRNILKTGENIAKEPKPKKNKNKG
jgi:predicted nucleotidyltransferase